MLTVPCCRSFPAVRFEKAHAICTLSRWRSWRKQEDSNPQAVSRNGFLDRDATIYVLCFRICAVPELHWRCPHRAPIYRPGLIYSSRKGEKGGKAFAGKTEEKPRHFCPAFAVAPMVILYHANMGIFNPILGLYRPFTDTNRSFLYYAATRSISNPLS